MTCGCALAAYLGLWQLLGNSVAFDIERWENNSRGLHNIDRDQISGTVAVSAEGSRANKVNSTHYKHYFFPSGRWTVHSIYRRPENIAYQVDDQAKATTILRCTCTWEEPTPQSPDRECHAVAKSHLGSAIQVGGGAVARIPVIRYRVTDCKHEHEAAFAPQFGCALLEERRTTYNMIGIPASRFHFIARSYVPGEPKRESLHPPLGYTVREKPL